MRRIVAVILLVLILLTIPALPSAGKPKIPKGAYGVWEMSSTSTTSVLYKGNISTKADQKIVDRENSACWRTYSKGHLIADHADSVCGKGVWRIDGVQIGSIATLTTSKGRTIYQCTALWYCTQTKYVFRWQGQTVSVAKGDVICVSCADEDGWNYVAYFKKCG